MPQTDSRDERESAAIAADARTDWRRTTRLLLPVLGVPVVTAGMSLAYYLTRSSFIVLWTTQWGHRIEEVYAAMGLSRSGSFVGVVLAMVIGAIGGPWAALLSGAFLTAAGLLLGTLPVPLELLGVPLAIAAAGWTGFGVGALSVLVDGVRGERAWLMLLGVAAWFAAVNLGAGVAPLVADASSEPWWLQLAGGLVASLDVVLAAGLLVSWALLGRSAPVHDPRRRTVFLAPPLVGAGFAIAAVGLGFVTYAGMALSMSSTRGPPLVMLDPTVLQLLNPIVCIGTAILLGLVGLILHLLGVRARSLPVLGLPTSALLALVALSLVLLLWVPGVGVTALVLLAVAETLYVVTLALAWRGIHWRLIAPIVGVHRLGLLLLGPATNSFWEDTGAPPGLLTWGLPVLALVLAAVSGVLVPLLWRLWDAPDESAASAPLPSPAGTPSP